jgi:hypothetical protein
MDPEDENKTEPSLPVTENPLQSETPMPRTRRSKLMEHEAKRNITLAIIGIIAVVALFIMFGVAALQKLSDLTIKEKDAAEIKKPTVEIINPPTLDSTFTATNSAEVTISGNADEGDSVKLYVNNAYTDKEDLESDKSFTFDGVTLKEGVNTVRAKVIAKGKESNFSDTLKISYYGTPPSLDIISPADGRAFNHDQNPIKVSGKTTNNANITVNDHRAIMETDGNFEYSLFLHDGDNDIKVTAEDEAGNKTEKHIKAILQ